MGPKPASLSLLQPVNLPLASRAIMPFNGIFSKPLVLTPACRKAGAGLKRDSQRCLRRNKCSRKTLVGLLHTETGVNIRIVFWLWLGISIVKQMKRFRLSFSYSMLLMFCTIWAVPPSFGQAIESWNSGCLKELQKFEKKPSHKAFAVSNSNDGGSGGQRCGWAAGMGSIEQAKKKAVEFCSKGTYGGTCWITRSQ